jgi:hypothetical protein
MYCNRTATRTVWFGTQRTQKIFGAGKNAAKRLIYRTWQYATKCRMWNLQGGVLSRWPMCWVHLAFENSFSGYNDM